MKKLCSHGAGVSALALMLTVGLVGCQPGGGGGNTPPVAQAGSNQTVAAGENVQLDGSDSSDANADTLGFAWVQEAGTAVTLTGANTATPSFVAPAGPVTLTFQLTVDDGNGGTDTDTVNVQVEAAPVLTSFLVVETDGERVVGLDDPAAADGDAVEVDTNIDLVNTGVEDIAVDAENNLYIVLKNESSILIYDDATTATDPGEPARTVAGENTQLNFPKAIAVDKDAGILYFANDPLNFRAEIRVFVEIDEDTFDGDVAPTRTFSTAAGNAFRPLQLLVHNGDLWVVDDRDGDTKTSILVFENAASLEDVVIPDRTITSPLLAAEIAIHIDENDRLYAVDQTSQILIWDGASDLDGEPEPDVQLTVTGAERINHLVVDTDDTAYLADGFNVIYAIEGISELTTGDVVPDRVIEGADISSPDKLEIVVPLLQ